ncbi:MAG: UvrB/UvrC motif-containing protein [Clostridiaceae bacterium]|jgi:protein arginine kinase activator|nr:UvrB/UvrC motif-containing protein [Clostridiaceae bacterium]
MICDECGKRPAAVHITKVENGKKSDMHLCEQCAMQKNLLNLSTSFSINDLLAGLLNSGGASHIKTEMVNDVKCDVCGLSYSKFKETGRFGCGNCYKVFGERLNPLFKKVHGNTSHTGKIPNRAGGRIKVLREVERLKQLLDEAIRNEEYEKAAAIRDEIREINKTEKGEA